LLILIIFSCERKWDNPNEELGNHAIVTTRLINSITANSATSGGNVTSDGGSTVTAKGVCFSTSQNPTISGSHTTNGTGTGSFTSNITGLTASTTYYVRAYATNSAGTSYGSQLIFTTSANINLPTVITIAISSITANSAVSGGYVTSDGGATVTAKGVCWSISENPTITDGHTSDGTETRSFTSNITGLSASTTYYVRAYATNSVGTAYGNELEFKTDKPDITGQTGTLTDIDGNTYNWVGIGKQAWMAENLKTTHYVDGTEIPIVTDNTDWVDLDYNDDAYCYYNNDASGESDTYGALYTYAAAKDACPAGWHLPSDAEWTELKDYIADDGHYGIEGTALKATSGWYSNGNGTDDYGFSALPGGYRYDVDGTFYNVGIFGYWWSSPESSSSRAYARNLYYGFSYVNRGNYDKSSGFSVRCVRDN
ncbi:MAG: hypothetical protein DRJ01_13560, partial [Bacteroidetes bacterium]